MKFIDDSYNCSRASLPPYSRSPRARRVQSYIFGNYDMALRSQKRFWKFENVLEVIKTFFRSDRTLGGAKIG